MEFVKTEINGVSLIKVELLRATLKEVEEFKMLLMGEVQLGKKNIVVDLSDCDFIDSTFLGTLVMVLKKLTAVGGDLRLVGFKPSVKSMFELTRMYRVFDSFEKQEDAIKSFD